MQKTTLAALASGLLFGLGLTISGMVNPAKVLAFLDIAGDWDPTLAFVMGGAILAAFPAFQWAKRHGRPFFAEKWSLPDRTDIDTKLVIGSALFGIGWGLAGFCPGPALAALGLATEQALTFVVAMTVGALVYRYMFER